MAACQRPAARTPLTPLAVLLVVALVCFLPTASAGIDWKWRTGRSTHYGGDHDPWSIHVGSCEYYYLDKTVGTGWDIAAISDVASDFQGSCGRCYEIACDPQWVKDGYGEGFDRKDVCHDAGQSLVVTVTDTCPCHYPDNYYSNKRWCCGDAYHFDISIWAFERLADSKWGVIGIRYREVPCDHCPDKPAMLPSGQSPSSPDRSPPDGWEPSKDKRPSMDRGADWSSGLGGLLDNSGVGGWLGMSRDWNSWGSSGPSGATAECGKTYERGGGPSFKTEPGAIKGKRRMSFKAQLEGGKTPDYSVTLKSSAKGNCRSLSLTGLTAASWEGDWATYDVPLGAFAWQQSWDGGDFWGCSDSVSSWDVNQIDFQSNTSNEQKLCISDDDRGDPRFYDDRGPRGGRSGGWRGGSGGRDGGWGYQDRYNDNFQGRGGGGGGGYRGGGGGGDGYSGRGRGGGGDSGYYDGGGGGRGGGGGYHDDGYQGRGGGGRRGRGRSYNWGRAGGRGGGGAGAARYQPRPRDSLPDDVAALTELKQHTKPVTCMCLDVANQQLYTGAQDGLVCAWSCASGQLVTSADCGMPVDTLLVEAGFLFVAISQQQESAIKVWNLGAGGATHMLTGHLGQVLALAVSPPTGMLFSGGLDASIRVWELNAAAGAFSQRAVLTAAAGGGHKAAVHALLVAGQFMFSGDRGGEVKVWNLADGSCVQTIERAHDGPIMKMLVWGENYMLTASMDGTIRCWSPGAGLGALPPAVISPEPEFTFSGGEEEAAGGGGGGRPNQYVRGQEARPAILSICTTLDAAQASVLMVSYVNDRAVRLFELPSFDARGCLPNVHECRAMLTLPDANTMVAGDKNGSVKIFQWKAPPMAT
ncbi:MAG: WD40-repeat-containing domain protein [Monoraphidium minutum]|nr:MAG: WD40-repeat-containing domain protein [Monoraphidium minutum]